MPKKKGCKKTGGRKKGVPNKLPRNIKERVVAVWNQLEEEGKGLYETGTKNPEWFYVNFVKPMVPKDLDIKASGELKIILVEETIDG